MSRGRPSGAEAGNGRARDNTGGVTGIAVQLRREGKQPRPSGPEVQGMGDRPLVFLILLGFQIIRRIERGVGEEAVGGDHGQCEASRGGVGGRFIRFGLNSWP